MFKIFIKKLNKIQYLYIYVVKLSVYSLVFTVFLFWLTTQITFVYETYLSYFFILTIGIMHGSNDIALIKTVKWSNKASNSYLLYYIGLILLNIIVFLFWPTLALICFVVMSCYHFGEQHFHYQITTHNYLSRLLFLAYGVLIFGLLFYFNSESTSAIIQELTGYVLTKMQFLWFMSVGIGLTILLYSLNYKNFKVGHSSINELFLILLFAILFKLAALLWAFAIYFVVWHSIPSLTDQIKILYGDYSKHHIIRYVKSSVVYWLISLLGLIILYYTIDYFQVNFVTIFFVFLAAITIPHVVVMYFLNKHN